ncbi:hypothetical protein M087_4790 [Bacteroides fragilis str. S23 R14]|uniref:Uncharacterized protein n=1 Tax=Bacteroides fragilis str. 2-F-2 \|nr:hypothetical protein M077_3807 [Bacteroides fragilis str. 2-F-2 \
MLIYSSLSNRAFRFEENFLCGCVFIIGFQGVRCELSEIIF